MIAPTLLGWTLFGEDHPQPDAAIGSATVHERRHLTNRGPTDSDEKSPEISANLLD
jgi:hypothetical protein